MGSNLPIPPEEHKLKDDYAVDVQVSYVALIFMMCLLKLRFKIENFRLVTVLFFFFFLNDCHAMVTKLQI